MMRTLLRPAARAATAPTARRALSTQGDYTVVDHEYDVVVVGAGGRPVRHWFLDVGGKEGGLGDGGDGRGGVGGHLGWEVSG